MTTATLVHPEAGAHSQASPFVSTCESAGAVHVGAVRRDRRSGRPKIASRPGGLLQNKYLPQEFAIVGIGRRDKTDQAFRDDVPKDLAEFRKGASADGADDFLTHVFYQRSDFTTAEGMRGLAERLRDLERERHCPAIGSSTWRPIPISSPHCRRPGRRRTDPPRRRSPLGTRGHREAVRPRPGQRAGP